MQVGHCLRLSRRVLRSYNILGIALGVCLLVFGLLRARRRCPTLVGRRKEGRIRSIDRSRSRKERLIRIDVRKDSRG